VIYPPHFRIHLLAQSEIPFCAHPSDRYEPPDDPTSLNFSMGKHQLKIKRGNEERKSNFNHQREMKKKSITKMKNQPYPRTPPTLKFPPVCNSCPNNSGWPQKHSTFRNPKCPCETESWNKGKPKDTSLTRERKRRLKICTHKSKNSELKWPIEKETRKRIFLSPSPKRPPATQEKIEKRRKKSSIPKTPKA